MTKNLMFKQYLVDTPLGTCLHLHVCNVQKYLGTFSLQTWPTTSVPIPCFPGYVSAGGMKKTLISGKKKFIFMIWIEYRYVRFAFVSILSVESRHLLKK